MNVSTKEFWEKAAEYDKSIRKYRYPKIRKASLILPRTPSHGPGSKGGGRIVICENCGTPVYTSSSSQEYCCRACFDEFMRGDHTPIHSTKYKRRSNVTKICPFCNKKFKVSTSYINRGHGVYCCNKCSSRMRGFKAIWFKCNNCKAPFKGIIEANALYCCEECKNNDIHYDGDNDEIYVNRSPIFLDNEETYEYIINMKLEIILRYSKRNLDSNEINITQQLRMMVVENKDIDSIPNYYLTSSQRNCRNLLGMRYK